MNAQTRKKILFKKIVARQKSAAIKHPFIFFPVRCHMTNTSSPIDFPKN